MGRHKERTELGREFGATDVVPERGEEGDHTAAGQVRIPAEEPRKPVIGASQRRGSA
jgi:hypothetical protein